MLLSPVPGTAHPAAGTHPRSTLLPRSLPARIHSSSAQAGERGGGGSTARTTGHTAAHSRGRSTGRALAETSWHRSDCRQEREEDQEGSGRAVARARQHSSGLHGTRLPLLYGPPLLKLAI